MKRILSVFLALVIVLGSMLCMGFGVSAHHVGSSVPTSKTCPNKLANGNPCNAVMAVHYHPETCTTAGYYEYVCTSMKDVTGYSVFTPLPEHGHGNMGLTTVVTIVPTCTTPGVKETYCNECGNVISTVTGSSEAGKNDPDIKVKGHTNKVWVETLAPTAVADGVKTQYCTDCGVALAETAIAKHAHVKGATTVVRQATCTSTGLEGTLCAECGVCYETKSINAINHSAPVYVTSIPATCTTKGENKGLCTNCGEVIAMETVNSLGHDDGEKLLTIAPTCTEYGEISTVCTRCGETKATEVVGKLGHDEGVWTTTIDPTCELDGEEVNTCTRCGEITESKAINALDHAAGYWVVQYEATPDHDGRRNKFCSRCDMLLDTEEFKMHTHEKGYEKVLVPATCTVEGSIGIFCAKCGDCYDVKVIEPTKHTYGPWFYNNDLTHSHICSKCGHKETENCKIEVTVTPNTCTSYGYTTNVCSECSFTFTTDITEPMGHKWSKWIDDGNGLTHTRKCERTDCTASCCEGSCKDGCTAEQTGIHVWGPWIFNKNNKFFKNGTMYRECALCEAKEERVCPHSSKIELFFAKIKMTLCKIFAIKIVVPVYPGPDGVIIIDNDLIIDSDIDSSIDSDSDSGMIS